jgi:hypothetical protein
MTIQLTRDTDSGRLNNNPCIVVSPLGQQFIFYDKYLTSGKQSYSRITFTSPSFTVNVEAGNGSINGTPVTWLAGTLTATHDTYQIVYVTTDGVLHIDLVTVMTMTLLKDVIILAYVSSGNSSITRIEEVEHTGYYIYLRKQVPSGPDWVWDDLEYRVNTGEQPKAFYDASANKIYMTYKKDSIAYVRVFDPTDELTWSYLPNIAIASNVITLNRNPQNSIRLSLSSGSQAKSISIEFDLSAAGFSFIDGNTYVFLPLVGGSFVTYVKDITYEFYTLGVGGYTLEESYVIPNYPNRLTLDDRWKLWAGSIGIKYVGIRLHSYLFAEEFVTDPENYRSFEIYARPAKVLLTSLTYNTDARDDMLISALSAGSIASIVKTYEYEESKTAGTASYATVPVSSGYESTIVKTYEYDESKAPPQTDSLATVPVSSGYEAIQIFTDH